MSYPWLRLETRRDLARQWLTWAVRMKLDLCGCRISLSDWQSLSTADRLILHEYNVENDEDMAGFRDLLLEFLANAGLKIDIKFDNVRSRSARDELELEAPPPRVVNQLKQWHLTINWDDLNQFGRYVICAIASKRNPESYRDDLVHLVRSVEFSRLQSHKTHVNSAITNRTEMTAS